jgi:hypothetical protein
MVGAAVGSAGESPPETRTVTVTSIVTSLVSAPTTTLGGRMAAGLRASLDAQGHRSRVAWLAAWRACSIEQAACDRGDPCGSHKEVAMARLIVEAEGTGGEGALFGAARPGNSGPLYLVVSVTRTSGVPIGGLGAADFRIVPIMVAAGGALVDISSLSERQPGAYLVEVVPIPNAVWQSGRYIFWIAVTSSANQGQTVASVFVH